VTRQALSPEQVELVAAQSTPASNRQPEPQRVLLFGAVLWFLNRDLGGVVFVPYLLLVPGFASVGMMVAVRRRGHWIG
jgi:hypothetical protein